MKKSLSITMRFSIAMTAVVVALLTLFGMWQYMTGVSRLQGELRRQASTTAERAGSAVQIPLWEMFDSAVLAILNTEMKDDNIVGLFVWNADHKAIAYGYIRDAAGQPVESKTVLADTNRIEQVEVPILYAESGKKEAQTIGHMQVAFSKKSLEQERKRILFSALAVVSIGFCVALLLAILVSRSISRPVVVGVSQLTSMAENSRRLADALQEMATGDLSRSIQLGPDDSSAIAAREAYASRGDEIGILFRSLSEVKRQMDNWIAGLRKMSENTSRSLRGVMALTEEVRSGASQIAGASQTLSQGATETAASLEEISASATEIGQQATHNAETATQANALATGAKTAAETGSQRMKGLNASMEAITESSAQIAKIIKTIDDIAFQTNILALNAAVEAARAGRHGKGFAVVAEEVRSLAARSAKAARETADLIEGSKSRVDEGNRMARETAEALSEIVSGIVKVGDLVGEMAAASNEQALGITQISQGLGQIDQVTQQNTATAEETSASAEQLSGQADELRTLVAQFKLQGGPAAGNVRTRPGGKTSSAPRAIPAPPHTAPPNGNEGGGRPQAPQSKPVSNEEIISLEDKDFGRY